MKRKAIQLAKQTIVVSLPADWVKKYGIKKGDEIEIEEKGRELVIGAKKVRKEGGKIEIDITGLNEKVIEWLISALYKRGYDEIILRYDKPIIIKTIERLVKNLFIDIIIVEQHENSCVLKSVLKDFESEFNAILRRIFLVLISMGESCLNSIKQRRLANLKELIALEHTNHQLTNFCERVLIKKGYKDYKKINFIFTIIWNLETICDEYRAICKYLSSPENCKTKISEEVINLFEEVNNFLESYYRLFYKFDLKKLNELKGEEEKIGRDIEKCYKLKKGKDSVIVGCLWSIVKKAGEFSTSIISMNY